MFKWQRELENLLNNYTTDNNEYKPKRSLSKLGLGEIIEQDGELNYR